MTQCSQSEFEFKGGLKGIFRAGLAPRWWLVYALALGYEDVNDHEQLRQDPIER